ncbi:MAG: class I SAM-dependent methyltransferase [Chloroflexi bacterium]|nr:class I SAM-dependent methyltransferase [Chloroflexota bacterium]
MAELSPHETRSGHTVYNRALLSIYDLFVLGFLCRFMWKCPSRHLLELYNQHVTSNHLDVGVGTGHFLDHCKFPSDTPRIALIDLNTNSLDVTEKRLSRYAPVTYCRDALEPINIDAEPFDSAAINGLLHCLPGTILTKSVVFDHLKPLLNPGGVIFGCTILNNGVKKSRPAQWTMNSLNRRKVFTNLEDDLQDLREELSKRFRDNEVKVIGCMALFWART